MMTLRQFFAEPSTIPTIASWYIADLSKAQGKQKLFTHQSSQKLKILSEHALIESALSSNRIEGVNIDQSRIDTLILGKPLLKDQDEEEVRGRKDGDLQSLNDFTGMSGRSFQTFRASHRAISGACAHSILLIQKKLEFCRRLQPKCLGCTMLC